MRAPFVATCLLIGGFSASAQYQPPPASPNQEIAFDRPEAWAMKYFVAATTFTPLAPPEVRRPGSIDLGVEAGWIPRLSDSQRRVGFEGTSLEDLNKVPVVARPRLGVGLPGGLALEVGWIPPIEIHGQKTNLLSAAIERPFLDTGAFALGLRLWGQIGHSKGDVTCPESIVSSPAGSAGNPLGCSAPSADVATLNAAGPALTGGIKVGRGAIHFAGGATYNDVAFQVGAYLNGKPDNTYLETHGWTGWGAAGIGWALGEKTWLAAEAFYSPLSVKRPPSTSTQNDGLFNVRGLLRFRLP